MVDCYWTLRGDGGQAQRVLPDGCLDLLFDLGTCATGAQVVGTMTTAIVAEPGAVGVPIDPRETHALAGVSPVALFLERARAPHGMSETFNPARAALDTLGA